MGKKLLPKNFFRNNPLNELSAANLSFISMFAMWNDEFQDKMWETLGEEIEPERKRQIETERVQIAQMKSGEEAVKFIRTGYDVFNREILCKKLLTMPVETMPPLLRRFRTSGQDILIETASHAFAHAEPIYIDQLITMYPEIRNPYAQCLACLVFGIQKREEALPLLLREYERLRRAYPEEDYCQGPLLAIYILDGKA